MTLAIRSNFPYLLINKIYRVEKLMLKVIVVLSCGIVIGTLGDIILAQGVKSLGDIKVNSLTSLWNLVKKVVHTPRILIAVCFMIACFLIWLTVLSWADLSLVLPMTAMSYVLNAILAKPMLGETVSPRRWLGTFIVFLGVVIVTLSGQG